MAKSVLVAMSGGVDSSVAAYLIKKEGYEAVGVTLSLYKGEDAGCPEKATGSLSDVEDAKSVANQLSMEHCVFNYQNSFKTDVIDRFVSSYIEGKTPNPCIDCNKYIKFKKLFESAEQMNIDCISTGHYAIIEHDKNMQRYLLKKAIDLTKDQSYVLYSLDQNRLSKTLLPLGSLEKSEVRKIAQENGFLNARKSDSQDICFVPDGKYADFIEKHTGKCFQNGQFVDTKGAILGEHKGIIRYTTGQRKGLGLALPNPMYVYQKDMKNNRVILSDEYKLFSKSFYANDINLITQDSIDRPLKVRARVRYKQKEQWATVEQVGGDRIHVEFDSPQRAITSGQAVVLYDDDVVIGGGTIE